MAAVRTYVPIKQNRVQMTRKIARFWDKVSEGWAVTWGPHIHHGYYENQSLTPLEAQELLIEKLVEEMQLSPSAKILDVGCGLGGSAIYLAKNYQATVHGISLSQKQVRMASAQVIREKIKNVSFKMEDALKLSSFAHESFDVIWSLESCEQFCDKALFVEKAYQRLRPGGTLLLVTWCSDNEEYEKQRAKDYLKLCHAFDLPYMPTMAHYQSLLKRQGFMIDKKLDWTAQVKKSWDVGINLANAYNFLQLLKMCGWRGFRFTKQLRLMQAAFNNNTIRYGVFIARKPESWSSVS